MNQCICMMKREKLMEHEHKGDGRIHSLSNVVVPSRPKRPSGTMCTRAIEVYVAVQEKILNAWGYFIQICAPGDLLLLSVYRMFSYSFFGPIIYLSQCKDKGMLPWLSRDWPTGWHSLRMVWMRNPYCDIPFHMEYFILMGTNKRCATPGGLHVCSTATWASPCTSLDSTRSTSPLLMVWARWLSLNTFPDGSSWPCGRWYPGDRHHLGNEKGWNRELIMDASVVLWPLDNQQQILSKLD